MATAFYLDREDRALRYFEKALEACPDDEDTESMINWCKKYIAQQKEDALEDCRNYRTAYALARKLENYAILGEMEGGDTNDHFSNYWDDDTEMTYPLILAKIPVKNPWEIFAYLPFGNWNECPNTPELYGFCPDVIGQGLEDSTVGALADVLRQSTVWYFWWD